MEKVTITGFDPAAPPVIRLTGLNAAAAVANVATDAAPAQSRGSGMATAAHGGMARPILPRPRAA